MGDIKAPRLLKTSYRSVLTIPGFVLSVDESWAAPPGGSSSFVIILLLLPAAFNDSGGWSNWPVNNSGVVLASTLAFLLALSRGVLSSFPVPGPSSTNSAKLCIVLSFGSLRCLLTGSSAGLFLAEANSISSMDIRCDFFFRTNILVSFFDLDPSHAVSTRPRH